MSILCLDIGSGTQDALLYDPGTEIHNCPKFILPSPARMAAARIRELADRFTPIYLHGHNMGGGFAGAVRKALEAGVPIAAHPAAAKSMGDDLSRVEAMGVELAGVCPAGHSPVYLADFDPGFWNGLLASAGLPAPDAVIAAAQDHGAHADCGNREGRFRLWREFLLQAQGSPQALVYETVPPELTRLADLQAQIGGGPVADTGSAAVLGALSMPDIDAETHQRGVCLVNVGNSHTIAFLLYKGRIFGVYEHHTGLLDADKLRAHLDLFRAGRLSHQTVYDDRGHGCLTLDLPEFAAGFAPTCVLGPRREMLADAERNHGYRFLSPAGDMMLAGCHGLLKGVRLNRWLPPEAAGERDSGR